MTHISIEQKFPNGFESWMETHHDVVDYISRKTNAEDEENTEIVATQDTHGTGGIYLLAEEWTDEFETVNNGREWDGEYFDEIEEFLNKKNYKQ